MDDIECLPFNSPAVATGTATIPDLNASCTAVGYTNSHSHPTENPFQPTFPGDTAVVVTEVNSTGTGLIFSTFLGGSGSRTTGPGGHGYRHQHRCERVY